MTRSREPSLRQELSHNLQISLATGLIGGGLLGFLATAASLILNPGGPGSLGNTIRLLIGLQAVYTVLCLCLGMAGAGLKTLFYLVTGRSISDTKASAFAAWLVFFLITALYAFSWARWQKVGGLAPGAPLGWSSLPVLLAIALLSILVAFAVSHSFYLLIIHFKKPERRRPGDLRRAFLLLLYMAAAFAIFLVGARVTAARKPAGSGLTQEMIHAQGRRVVLLTLDGMSRADLQRLREEGTLSCLDSLAAGTDGSVAPPEHPVPPMDWTLAATGVNLGARGITDFQTQTVKGLPIPAALGPEQLGLFELVHNVLPFLRMTRTVPVKSYMRETKGLWNIASDAGKTTVVVNWWVSWPAERVRGAVITDHAWVKLTGEGAGSDQSENPEARAGVAARVAASVQTPGRGLEGATSPLRPDGRPLLLEGETWPSTLLIELLPLAVTTPAESLTARYGALPDSADLAALDRSELPRDLLRADLFYAQAAAWLLDRRDPDLLMLHLPGPDIIRRVLARRDLPRESRERMRREALQIYWRWMNGPLARLTRASRDRLVLLVTLPGLRWTEEPRAPGAVRLAGPGSRMGAVTPDLRLAEIAPSVLWLLGLPVARDMEAGPRTDLVGAELAGALSPVRWIPSYGRQDTEGLERAAGSLDQEMLERFRSLGYTQE